MRSKECSVIQIYVEEILKIRNDQSFNVTLRSIVLSLNWSKHYMSNFVRSQREKDHFPVRGLRMRVSEGKTEKEEGWKLGQNAISFQ